MTVKGMDGQTYNVTSQSQGNFNTAGSIAGIASLLGFDLGGLGAGMRNAAACGCNENQLVNRYELNMVEQLNAKDSEIALLKAENNTEKKIVEVTAYLQGEIGKVASKLEAFKESQYAVNLQQATLNATQTATIGCIQSQVAQLQGLSRLYVPSSNVCQSDCCGCVTASN